MKKILFFIIISFGLNSYSQTIEEIEMVSMINQIRTNPESFIPSIESYIVSVNMLKNNGATYINKSNGKSVDVIEEAISLVLFLKTITPVGVLEQSNELYPITKSHSEYLYSTNQLSHIGPNGESLLDRTKSTSLNCGENCVESYNITNALVQLLVDLNSKTKGHRDNIFNAKYTKIAVAKSGNIWVQNFGY